MTQVSAMPVSKRHFRRSLAGDYSFHETGILYRSQTSFDEL